MARACDWVTRDAFAAAGGSDFAALKLFESAPASAGVSDRVTGAVRPVNRAWSFLPSVTPAPNGWPPRSWRTSTSPVITVKRVV